MPPPPPQKKKKIMFVLCGDSCNLQYCYQIGKKTSQFYVTGFNNLINISRKSQNTAMYFNELLCILCYF